jgi:hypothetical protein
MEAVVRCSIKALNFVATRVSSAVQPRIKLQLNTTSSFDPGRR